MEKIKEENDYNITYENIYVYNNYNNIIIIIFFIMLFITIISLYITS
jgi:ABC-type multidrug transport system permease subunit